MVWGRLFLIAASSRAGFPVNLGRLKEPRSPAMLHASGPKEKAPPKRGKFQGSYKFQGSTRETPNNPTVAGGIGGCGIILDAGAAENGLRGRKTGFVLGFPDRFWSKTESGRDQTRPGASRVFLTITRLARANRVRSCAVFLARPR